MHRQIETPCIAIRPLRERRDDVALLPSLSSKTASSTYEHAFIQTQVAEHEVVAGIKRDLRSSESIEEVRRRVRAAKRAATKSKAPDYPARIAVLKQKVANLADAIASGILRASPTLAGRTPPPRAGSTPSPNGKPHAAS